MKHFWKKLTSLFSDSCCCAPSCCDSCCSCCSCSCCPGCN